MQTNCNAKQLQCKTNCKRVVSNLTSSPHPGPPNHPNPPLAKLKKPKLKLKKPKSPELKLKKPKSPKLKLKKPKSLMLDLR